MYNIIVKKITFCFNLTFEWMEVAVQEVPQIVNRELLDFFQAKQTQLVSKIKQSGRS